MKGASAKYIRRPLFKKIEEDGKDEQRLIGFKWVKCMFEASDTEGDPLPEFETPEWSEQRALGALAINKVAFEQLDGNIQGYSYENSVAINPVAAYPRKTLIHEMAHVCLKHTTPEAHEDYKAHRGVKEFEAEGTAYVVMNRLDQLDSFDAEESRFYIRRWLGQDVRPPDESLRAVVRVADQIVKAGRKIE
ncbi:hypothetical protein [Rhodococcus sp. IEGM 1374]|uniref:hypothetical protein n=1 Tax=Rhodococcus sp. IEGM 1374 TaxID=3082221 RepID=UPI0029544A1C|nr:hypothetical protein [Rhodococcus sp. IEGM 1374]MDV7992082.1 hypothetical protein [Rhodococcus sp. IEGM 1374]